MRTAKKTKKCEFCGRDFLPRDARMRYCSPYCSRQDGFTAETRTCSCCKKEFTVIKKSRANKCPDCRGHKRSAAAGAAQPVKKEVRGRKITSSTDNTPYGAKQADMWLGEIPKHNGTKPVKAKMIIKKLPEPPYRHVHMQKTASHNQDFADYRMPNRPSRSAYTPEQDAIIRAMFDAGSTWEEIGSELGRSGDAVRQHAFVIFGGTIVRERRHGGK